MKGAEVCQYFQTLWGLADTQVFVLWEKLRSADLDFKYPPNESSRLLKIVNWIARVSCLLGQ